jgi:uncharacterized protein (DUF2147 family)
MQVLPLLLRGLLLPVITLFLFTAQMGHAATNTPVGLWQTIDDQSGKPRSLIRISQKYGKLSAVIEKGLLATDTPDAVCEKCKDERKGQKIIGMTIAEGLTKDGDQYTDGKILDPENGKIYNCKMQLNEAGDELEVRGYIGISLIGRSQIWKRVE